MPPSSSGLGHHPFKVAAGIRIPLGALQVAAKCGGQIMEERLEPRFWYSLFYFPIEPHFDPLKGSIDSALLLLARYVVWDNPLPWQPAQKQLTPERTFQGFGATLAA